VGGTAVGFGASVGLGASVGVAHAASKRLKATKTNINGRTNLVISIFSFNFLYAVILPSGF
jgi:hypothetical protein